jgi:hypothetical protein
VAHRDISISFRFFALTAEDLAHLRHHRPDARSRPSRFREGCVTGVFDLEPAGDYSWLDGYVQERSICRDESGLFVSVSTSSDSEIVRIPDYAIALVRAVGGVVDFSFTVLSDT